MDIWLGARNARASARWRMAPIDYRDRGGCYSCFSLSDAQDIRPEYIVFNGGACLGGKHVDGRFPQCLQGHGFLVLFSGSAASVPSRKYGHIVVALWRRSNPPSPSRQKGVGWRWKTVRSYRSSRPV